MSGRDRRREPSGRSLSEVRSSIDAVDHELLGLLGRRSELVAEIAQYKRDHHLAIRDCAREGEIIEDRRNRAASLDLSPEMIESLYRLILWNSRNRQAMLRAEVPKEEEARTVGVIGGRGAVGRCMARLFGGLGHTVRVADRDTEVTPAELAASCDVVVISVPIEVTVAVIEQVGPHVREDALLIDVTSIKAAPISAMLTCSKASVVGTHPLFAPSVHSLQGQRVILCRGRGDAWFDWLSRMLHAAGLVIREASPQDHDRAMSIVQVLVHFSTEVMGRTLARLGVDIEETLAFTSPIYLMELLMTARHFAQSPELYASIEMSNPLTAEVTGAFVEAAGRWRETVTSNNRGAFIAGFDTVRAMFGDFTGRALSQSAYLIDRLVERE